MTQNLRNENITEPEGRVSDLYRKIASKYRSEICEEQVGVLYTQYLATRHPTAYGSGQ